MVALRSFVLICLLSLSNGRPQNRFTPREGAANVGSSSSSGGRSNDLRRDDTTRSTNVIFPGEERRLSKTEEALRNLNLPMFLPSVPLSKFYVRPEFDFTGNRLIFDDNDDNDGTADATTTPTPTPRSKPSRGPEPRFLPESDRFQGATRVNDVTRVTGNKGVAEAGDVTGGDTLFRSDPPAFPESERVTGVTSPIFIDTSVTGPLFSEPDHVLKVTELLRSEDSDHLKFIEPAPVNAGVLPLASEDVDIEDDLEDFPPFTRKRAKSKKP